MVASGLNVDRVKILAFALFGTFAAIVVLGVRPLGNLHMQLMRTIGIAPIIAGRPGDLKT